MGCIDEELRAKTKASEVAKVGTFLVVERKSFYYTCTLILEGTQNNFTKRWQIDFDSSLEACTSLASHDSVKLTFRSAVGDGLRTRDWLTIEKLPTSPPSN